MELRKLQATDLFSMVRILNSIGIKNVRGAINLDKIRDARKAITKENSQQIISEIGTDVIMSLLEIILEHLPSVETDLYKFMGSVAGMSAKDVAKLEIVEFTDLIIAICQKEEFKDFFNRASKLIK